MPDNLARLYGINTVGAVAGAAATGFVLLRTFPVSAVVLIAAAVNLTICLTLRT